MNTPWTYLLYILRLAMGTNTEPVNTQPLSPDEWREVYRLAAKHAVIAIAWSGVEHLQDLAPNALSELPPDLMGKWFADAQAIVATNEYRAAMAEAVQDILHKKGFDSQLLKGAALAAYYPNPAHRQAADIDLWVLPKKSEKGSLSAHRKALLACLRQKGIVVNAVVYHHIETNIAGTDVEMHVTPTWLCNPVHNKRLQQLLADTGKLTPELQELYTLLHAFRHIYHDGIALRHLLDYHLVCRHNRNIGVQAPQTLYSRLGLLRFAGAMDELTDYCFGNQSSHASLSPRARHILQALPERQVSRVIRRDYPSESLFNFPWRTVHYLWRKKNHYV